MDEPSSPFARAAPLALLALLLPACRGTPDAGPREASIPFAWEHGLVFVELEQQDGPGGRRREPLLALLDTGASASAVDPRRSEGLPSLGATRVLGTTGAVEAELVRVEGLRLGGWSLPPLRATRRDLSGLLSPDARRVDLILGSDAFVGRALTLDFARARLEVGESRPSDGDAARLVLDLGIPAVEARVGGLPLWLRIDTGASLFETDDVYVNVPARVWAALEERHPGLEPTARLSGVGAAGRAVELPVYELREARVGRATLERVFVIVQPEVGYFARADAKGFVSNNWLSKLGRVTLDYGAGELRAGGGGP